MPPTSTTILFRKLTADSPAIGRIICAVTGGYEYHTEALTELGYFSAHYDEGVRFAAQIEHQDDPEYWDKIVVPVGWLPETLKWAVSISGAAYDPLGAILSGFDADWRCAGKWFCSFTSRECCDRNGFCGLPTMPNPHRLRLALDARLGRVRQAETPKIVFGEAEHVFLSTCLAQGKLTAQQVEQIWSMSL